MKSLTVLHFQCLMKRLTVSEDKFDFLFYISQEDCGIECLKEIANIMKDSDVSPFEIIHSGLVQKLLQYLTSTTGDVPRDVRIRRFLHIFLNCPVSTYNNI